MCLIKNVAKVSKGSDVAKQMGGKKTIPTSQKPVGIAVVTPLAHDQLTIFHRNEYQKARCITARYAFAG